MLVRVWKLLIPTLVIRLAEAIACYECIGGRNDPLCNRYTGASCGYGLFGCVKIATYSGGVDKSRSILIIAFYVNIRRLVGNFIDDDRSVISMIRGCNVLPLGGVDACQQAVFPGIRIVTCYCYNDYCNSTTSTTYSLTILFCSLVFLWIVF
jgi:hypothetical protein